MARSTGGEARRRFEAVADIGSLLFFVGAFFAFYVLAQLALETKVSADDAIHRYFVSVDGRAQILAALATLLILGLWLVRLYLRRADDPRAGALPTSLTGLASRLLGDAEAALGRLRPGRLAGRVVWWGVLGAAIVSAAGWLAYLGSSLAGLDDFRFASDDYIRMIDPHLMSVFGSIGESYLSPDVETFSAGGYGLGVSGAYAALRALGEPLTYATAFAVTRVANICAFAALVFVIWKMWDGSRNSVFFLISLLIVFTKSARYLLDLHGSHVVFPNLSALRYAPFFLVLIAVSLDLFSRPMARWAAVGVSGVCAYFFLEAGAVAAIAAAAMFAVEGRGWKQVLRLGAAALGAILLTVIVLAAIHRLFLTEAPPTSVVSLQILSLGYGGRELKWDPTTFAAILLAVFVLLTAARRLREDCLPRHQKLGLAAALLLVGWLPYYMYRPTEAFIYASLATVVISSMLFALQLRPVAPLRLGSLAMIAPILMVSGLNIVPKSSMWDRLGEPSAERRYYGIAVRDDVATDVRARFEELSGIAPRDALVVTSSPFAAMATEPRKWIPINQLFGLARDAQIQALSARLSQGGPDVLVIERPTGDSRREQALASIADRFEAALPPQFGLTASKGVWRVWRRRAP